MKMKSFGETLTILAAIVVLVFSYASCLAMQGVDLYAIQKLKRHKTHTMTRRYAHLAPSYLREAAESLSRKAGPDLAPLRVCDVGGSA